MVGNPEVIGAARVGNCLNCCNIPITVRREKALVHSGR